RGVKSVSPGIPVDSSCVSQVLNTNNGLPTIEANAVLADENFIYVGTDAGLAIIDRSMPFRDT
ncbi:MAG: hypothetical protein KDD06_06775, partial [Phaeodactylibacter sp.]|nr:hypothetical protein [Phaeodactylibacter sp.]